MSMFLLADNKLPIPESKLEELGEGELKSLKIASSRISTAKWEYNFPRVMSNLGICTPKKQPK